MKRAALPMMTPVIIIGGIWSGHFTPTESGAMACVYALFLGLVIYRDIGWRQLVESLRTTVLYSSIILYIIAIATFYGWLAVRLQIPQELATILTQANASHTMLLFGFAAFFLVIGCFMSALEAVLIFTPIFIVPVMSLGMDPVYFGIVMCLTLSVGVITPPFGNVIFVLVTITKQPFATVVMALLPFLIPILVAIVLIILFPSFVTFLPTYIQ